MSALGDLQVDISGSLVLDPAPYKPPGRPCKRNTDSEVQHLLASLVSARTKQMSLKPSTVVHGSEVWKQLRLGKVTGTLARAVRVDGSGKVLSLMWMSDVIPHCCI